MSSKEEFPTCEHGFLDCKICDSLPASTEDAAPTELCKHGADICEVSTCSHYQPSTPSPEVARMDAANQVAILAVQKDGYSGNAYKQVAIELQEKLDDSELAFNHANEVVGKLQADVERLEKTKQEWALQINAASDREVELLSQLERLTLTEAAYTSLFERHAALQRENAHLIDTMVQVVPDDTR